MWAHGLLVPDGVHSYDEFAAVDVCPLPPLAPPSLAGAGFLAEAAASSPAMRPANVREFVQCSHNFEVLTLSISDDEDDGFALVAPANDQLMCGLCDHCMMDTHKNDDSCPVSDLAVYICEGCQDSYHLHCVHDGLSDGTVSAVSWSDPLLVGCCSMWRCGDCAEADRWGGCIAWWNPQSPSAPCSVQ